MTDRELLELAAKAAGLMLGPWRKDFGAFMYGGDARPGSLGYWNPLTDDGDALRLAVKLQMNVDIGGTFAEASVIRDAMRIGADERLNGDPYAATRRAIVRAAATIGEQQ